MIHLTREQAELCRDLLAYAFTQIHKSDSPRHDEFKAVYNDLERQLNPVCTCGQHTKDWSVSMMCPVHGEELAKEEMDQWLAARGKGKLE